MWASSGKQRLVFAWRGVRTECAGKRTPVKQTLRTHPYKKYHASMDQLCIISFNDLDKKYFITQKQKMEVTIEIIVPHYEPYKPKIYSSLF
jgi:hypothetical protein